MRWSETHILCSILLWVALILLWVLCLLIQLIQCLCYLLLKWVATSISNVKHWFLATINCSLWWEIVCKPCLLHFLISKTSATLHILILRVFLRLGSISTRILSLFVMRERRFISHISLERCDFKIDTFDVFKELTHTLDINIAF